MDGLDEIIKNQVISSYENNLAFRVQLLNTFHNHYAQNVKYHMMWLFFHSFSFAYPDNPSDECKIETANFIANVIPKNLSGCGSCQTDYKTYIEKLNIFRIVSSSLELSSFFVDLHNYINGKKFELNNRRATSSQFDITLNNAIKTDACVFYDYQTVKRKYEQMDYISLLETKYNVNMFKLIESKSLASFYEAFNQIKFDATAFKIDIQII
jgi:hypothetical protein